MKKFLAFILSAISVLALSIPCLAAEAPISNVPYLEDISFDNAQIDGGFRHGETFFTLTLDDPSESASLKKYTVSGEANIFAEYKYDSSNHQTGITVTLNFESGSVIYTFNYSNAQSYKISSNANLIDLACEYGEVQPEINSGDTAYKLYVPSDLTMLYITPVTQDVNAYCAPVTVELRENQEIEIPLTVTASDATTKKYTFKVKRINKTVSEVKAEMEQPDYVSFVEGELFYQKPSFAIALGAAIGGLIAVAVIVTLIKRFAVNPYDSDEPEFYSPVE